MMNKIKTGQSLEPSEIKLFPEHLFAYGSHRNTDNVDLVLNLFFQFASALAGRS